MGSKKSSNYCLWAVILRFYNQKPQISIELTLLYTKLYSHLNLTKLLKNENEDRVHDCTVSQMGVVPPERFVTCWYPLWHKLSPSIKFYTPSYWPITTMGYTNVSLQSLPLEEYIKSIELLRVIFSKTATSNILHSPIPAFTL